MFVVFNVIMNMIPFAFIPKPLVRQVRIRLESEHGKKKRYYIFGLLVCVYLLYKLFYHPLSNVNWNTQNPRLMMMCCCLCSIESMFDSPQFKENINSYQQLLSEGVFDLSFLEAKTEDCKTLKRLTLSNLLKSKWVERYHLLKVWIDRFRVGTLLHENIICHLIPRKLDMWL